MIRRSAMLSAPVRLTALLLVLVIAATGCHRGAKKGDRPDEGVPVEQLYEKSHKLMQGGNWSGAEASFRRLVAQYPYGPYTEQAMIETAYAQYKAGKHDDAVSSIDRFIRTYPTHRNIAYLYYLRGLANSNRSTVFLRRVWSLDASRRDLSTPHQAYSDFNIVVDRYPNSRYAADARQRMLELRDVFAQHELDNALYYMRRGAWVSAVGRANYLLETYPQSAFQYDAVAVLADSYTHLGNKTLADDARRVLQLNQPDHPWLEGKWPKYPWMIRKLNPFAGEKSASTGQRNARLEKVRGAPEGLFSVDPRHAWTTTLGMLRIPGSCDGGRTWAGCPHCGAAATPAITERPMPTRPCSFRFLSCLLASALLALTLAPAAAARDAPGDLLSAAPYRAPWVPSRAAQAQAALPHPGSPRRAGRRHRPAVPARRHAAHRWLAGGVVGAWHPGHCGSLCALGLRPHPCRTRRALPGRVPGPAMPSPPPTTTAWAAQAAMPTCTRPRRATPSTWSRRAGSTWAQQRCRRAGSR